MCHGNNDNFVTLDRVYQAERKAPDQCSTEPVCDGNAKMRSLADRVNGTLYVIEEQVAKPRSRRLVEECGFGHLFLRERKEPIADHRSRLRALAIASSPGTDFISPRR